MKLAIKQLREDKGLSQAELAKLINVSSSAVGMWETGDRIPRTATLLVIASALECTLDDLVIKDADEQESSPATP